MTTEAIMTLLQLMKDLYRSLKNKRKEERSRELRKQWKISLYELYKKSPTYTLEITPDKFDSYEEYDEHRKVLDGLFKEGRVERIFDSYKWKENIPQY